MDETPRSPARGSTIRVLGAVLLLGCVLTLGVGAGRADAPDAAPPGEASPGEAPPPETGGSGATPRGAPISLPAGRVLTPKMIAEMAAASKRAQPSPVEAPEHVLDPDELPIGEPKIVEPSNLQLDSDGGAGTEGIAVFAYAPRLSASFIGHDRDDRPADPMIAAGPSHLVAVVNTQMAFFTKNGTNVAEVDISNQDQDPPRDNFFGLGPTDPGTFDPKIIFDPHSQRFFLIVLSVGANSTVGSFFHIAVSLTSDPTGNWCIYPPVRNDLGNEWLDYPGLGVSQRALYLTGMYNSGGTRPGWPAATPDRRNTLWVIDKAPMLTCGNAGIQPLDDVTSASEGMRVLKPSLTYGTPPGADAFVCALDPAPSPPRGLVMGVNLPVDFPASPPTVTKRWVTLNPVDAGGMANAPQQGGPALIVTNNLGMALMNAVYRNGRLWTVHHPSVGGLTVARPVEYDVSSWPNPTLASSVDFTDLTSFYYWPAVTVNDSGDAVMVFGRSSATEFASARWTLRFAGDSAFQGSQYLQAGVDYYGEAGDTAANVYRWGDYAGASVDPIDQGFWITHKFAQTRFLFGTTRNWNTWIGYIPRAVFVDGAHVGGEQGTRSAPWDTVGEGHADAFGNNDLVIRTGNYPEAVTLNKPVTIFPDGGPVTIGQ